MGGRQVSPSNFQTGSEAPAFPPHLDGPPARLACCAEFRYELRLTCNESEDMITIDELRRDWEKQIKTFEKLIEGLDSEVIPKGEGLRKPTRLWRTKLRMWRNELDELLKDHPGKR